MTAPEQNLLLFPELFAELSLAPAPGLSPYLPSPLIGAIDVKRLQLEGWRFYDRGIKLGNCWVATAAKVDKQKPFFLADPDQYPQAWGQEMNVKGKR